MYLAIVGFIMLFLVIFLLFKEKSDLSFGFRNEGSEWKEVRADFQ